MVSKTHNLISGLSGCGHFGAVAFTMLCLAFSLPVDVHGADMSDTVDVIIETDITWRYSRSLEPWWHSTSFDDGNWNNVQVPSNGLCGPTLIPEPHIARPIWAPNAVNGESVYFRKAFTLSEIPDEAILNSVFDDDGDIYINGAHIRSDRSGRVNMEPFRNDIRPYLTIGTNVIALYVIDSAGGCQSAQVRAELTMSFKSVELDVPLLKQTDNAWKSNEYAGGAKDNIGCGSTIGQCGCVVSSLAMLLRYYGVLLSPQGVQTSPASLNDFFSKDQICREGGCVSKGYRFGYVRWAAVNEYTKLAHDVFGSDKVQFVGRAAYDPEVVANDIVSNRPVVIRVKEGDHWVLGRGIVDEKIQIHDPFYENIQLGDNAGSSIARFTKTNSDFSLIEVTAHKGSGFYIVDESGRKSGYTSDGFAKNEIPGTTLYSELSLTDPSQSAEPSVDDNGSIWVVLLSTPQKGNFSIHYSGESPLDVYSSDAQADSEIRLLKSVHRDEGIYSFKYDPAKLIPLPSEDVVIVIESAHVTHTPTSEGSEESVPTQMVVTTATPSTVPPDESNQYQVQILPTQTQVISYTSFSVTPALISASANQNTGSSKTKKETDKNGLKVKGSSKTSASMFKRAIRNACYRLSSEKKCLTYGPILARISKRAFCTQKNEQGFLHNLNVVLRNWKLMLTNTQVNVRGVEKNE